MAADFSRDPKLILASGSPRRRMLLDRFDIAFTVVPADIDETPQANEPPDRYVGRLAVEKATVVFQSLSDRERSHVAVLGADTTVALNGMILGKPEDAEDAIRTLTMLSGTTHQVYTGIAVATASGVQHRVVVTNVTMSTLDASLIAWYVSTAEPFDKAGSYAIQERAGAFVSLVEGSMDNVVGLPMLETIELLAAAGVLTAYRSVS